MVLAPATPPPIQSWADTEHGWKAAGPGVEATDDGGRHWRVVFRYGAGGGADGDAPGAGRAGEGFGSAAGEAAMKLIMIGKNVGAKSAP